MPPDSNPPNSMPPDSMKQMFPSVCIDYATGKPNILYKHLLSPNLYNLIVSRTSALENSMALMLRDFHTRMVGKSFGAQTKFERW